MMTNIVNHFHPSQGKNEPLTEELCGISFLPDADPHLN